MEGTKQWVCVALVQESYGLPAVVAPGTAAANDAALGQTPSSPAEPTPHHSSTTPGGPGSPSAAQHQNVPVQTNASAHVEPVMLSPVGRSPDGPAAGGGVGASGARPVTVAAVVAAAARGAVKLTPLESQVVALKAQHPGLLLAVEVR